MCAAPSDAAHAISPERAAAILEAERQRFAARHPKSAELAKAAAAYWLSGVPMHWMSDWGTPFPLFIAEARGVRLIDADGHAYTDFCLGDTGAMFGHAPKCIEAALCAQAGRGLTTMLPGPDAAVVGALLKERFGLAFWQVTATASDANRSVIRWARAATGRKKLLVMNGCYHGAVDDTFVALQDGHLRNRPGLAGEVRDVTEHTRAVEFNDIAALDAALADEEVALVLAEPVMTNCGMVLPEPNYHEALRALTRKYGTLLGLDETHTISSGPGGYTGSHGLAPDFFVLGKPIAGGVPAAVYGWSAAVDARIRQYLARREAGYSGIGTTLSGSALQLACMRAVLENVLTEEVYAAAMPLAVKLEEGLSEILALNGLSWPVVRVGLRLEIVTAPSPPRNGTEALQHVHGSAERALHLYCINRGVLLTPFHNMMLVSPETREEHIAQLLGTLSAGLAELNAASPSRLSEQH